MQIGDIMQAIIDFFNHPFFIIVGGLSTLSAIVISLMAIYAVIKALLPVWYRLGRGLSNGQIAIFADEEYGNLKGMLVDSKIFKDKNIVQIDKNSIEKAQAISILLMHWKAYEDKCDDILRIKKDSDALIIYAPHGEGTIDTETLRKINSRRNAIVVNFRGRLLNDILVSMITTSYEKR